MGRLRRSACTACGPARSRPRSLPRVAFEEAAHGGQPRRRARAPRTGFRLRAAWRRATARPSAELPASALAAGTDGCEAVIAWVGSLRWWRSAGLQIETPRSSRTSALADGSVCTTTSATSRDVLGAAPPRAHSASLCASDSEAPGSTPSVRNSTRPASVCSSFTLPRRRHPCVPARAARSRRPRRARVGANVGALARRAAARAARDASARRPPRAARGSPPRRARRSRGG